MSLTTAALGVLTATALSPTAVADAKASAGSTGTSISVRATSTLHVRVRVSPQETTVDWSLTCHPSGGDHPRPRRACAALTHAKDPFAPAPLHEMCTEIYGGPQQATITGVWRGRSVHAHYSRVNGCETARWNAIKMVLSPDKNG